MNSTGTCVAPSVQFYTTLIASFGSAEGDSTGSILQPLARSVGVLSALGTEVLSGSAYLAYSSSLSSREITNNLTAQIFFLKKLQLIPLLNKQLFLPLWL